MNIKIGPVVSSDYDKIYVLWSSTEQSRRALNPLDDSKDGIERYLMPDIHAGMGCTVGTVMTFMDKVVPNPAGVDIE